MKPFSVKLKDGSTLLGLGVSAEEAAQLSAGQSITLDLGSIGVGLWTKESDGSRSFAQPRDSKIVLILGDTKERVGDFLGIKLP